jgi:hypothetical protein
MPARRARYRKVAITVGYEQLRRAFVDKGCIRIEAVVEMTPGASIHSQRTGCVLRQRYSTCLMKLGIPNEEHPVV